MSERLVSRSDLARLAGVTRAAITRAAKDQFPEGCVGTRIDVDHPKVVRYLAGHGVLPTAPHDLDTTSPLDPTTRRPAEPPVGAPEPPAREHPRSRAVHDAPLEAVTWDEIERYAHMSLDWLVRKYGTATVFVDWLDARKLISAIRTQDLKSDELAGKLIRRDLVQTHIFGALETLHRRLLGDAATAIARTVFNLAKNGAGLDEAERAVRVIIRDNLQPAKAAASRALRQSAVKVDDEDEDTQAA